MSVISLFTVKRAAATSNPSILQMEPRQLFDQSRASLHQKKYIGCCHRVKEERSLMDSTA
jgi:hypothetical protein